MRRSGTHVRRVAPPAGNSVRAFLPAPDYEDSFEGGPVSDAASMTELYVSLFKLPASVRALLTLRDALVAPFGIRKAAALKSAPIDRIFKVGDTVRGWRIDALGEHEIVAGADDIHLDFRVSLLRRPEREGARLSVTTAVKTHNALGRIYLATVLPFHRAIVSGMLTDALRSGRVSAPAGRAT